MKFKEIGVIIILVIIVIGIIFFIDFIRGNGSSDPETVQCIAENSILIVSKTCGHCANQKMILGQYVDIFDIRDLRDNPDIVKKYEISHIPAWIINENVYLGVHELKELKELTNC